MSDRRRFDPHHPRAFSRDLVRDANRRAARQAEQRRPWTDTARLDTDRPLVITRAAGNPRKEP